MSDIPSDEEMEASRQAAMKDFAAKLRTITDESLRAIEFAVPALARLVQSAAAGARPREERR